MKTIQKTAKPAFAKALSPGIIRDEGTDTAEYPELPAYEQMFMQSPVATMIFDKNGECIRLNRKMMDIFDIQPALDRVEFRYSILEDPAYDKSTVENLEKVFINQEPFQREIIYNFKKSLIFKKDTRRYKTPRWYNLRAYPVKESGWLKYVVVQFEDITAKKETERSLLQHSKELQILNNIIVTANNSNDIGTLLSDVIHHIIYNLNFASGTVFLLDSGNEKAAIEFSTSTDDRFFGHFTVLDINSYPYRDVFINGNPLFFENFGMLFPDLSISLGIKGFALIPFSVRDQIAGAIMIAGNNKHWFTDLEKKVLNSVGHEVGAVIERIRYANALKVNEKRYRNVFENSALGIFQSDPQCRLIAVNNAFARQFRFDTKEEAIVSINKSGNSVFLDKNQQRKLFDMVLNSVNSIYKHETEMVKKDKSTFIGKIIIQPVFNDKGDVEFFEGLIEDVTERKRSEARMKILNAELERRVNDRTILLEATNKELESFAYSVSHDLRQPLRSILGFSDALLSDYSNNLDGTGIDFLERINKSGRKMSNLIDDLLTLSRITSSDMQRQMFNLSFLIENLIDEYKQMNPGREVILGIEQDIIIKADKNLFRIAMENLISNAFKFTSKKDKTEISFGIVTGNGNNTFFLKDNGAGFDMKYSDKLFGAFQRLHKHEEFPGTGIGLATVKRIVHIHGGNIYAQSEQGKGTVFFFTIGEDQ